MAEVRKGRLGYEDTLNFVNSLCLTYILCSAVLRGWIRRGIYGLDDTMVAFATVLSLAFSASVYVALAHGAGKPWQSITSAGDSNAYNQASLAAVITFVLSLYLSKVSVVAFLVRITSQNRDVWVYRISLAMVSALGLASVFLVTTGWPLDIDSYWASYITAEACSTQTMRWSVFTAFDIITEILLLVLPLYMSWDLQMPLRRKVIVVGAFYLRLPLIGLSVGRYIYTKRLCAKGVDLGLDSALVLICLCIESAFALVASQFLAFRRFTLSFNSGFGLGFTVHAGPESYSMQRTGIKSNGNGGGSGNGRFWSRRGGSRQSPSTDSQNAAAARPMPPTLLDGQPVLTTHNGAHFRALSVPGHDWPEDRSSSGETTVDDMVNMREQEFSVQYQDNDESPILNRQGHTIRHSAKGAS